MAKILGVGADDLRFKVVIQGVGPRVREPGFRVFGFQGIGFERGPSDVLVSSMSRLGDASGGGHGDGGGGGHGTRCCYAARPLVVCGRCV